MERGELEQKLLELSDLKEKGLLSAEHVARTTEELLKTFTLPRRPVPAAETSAPASDAGGQEHTPGAIAQPAATPAGTPGRTPRGKSRWERLFCGNTREEADAFVAAMGVKYAWQSGGGKKGGQTKRCRTHKDCANMVRISLRKQGWVVATTGDHSSLPPELARGIPAKYKEDVDTGCHVNKTPKNIRKELMEKYGKLDDLPSTQQIDNRKRSLRVKESGGKKRRTEGGGDGPAATTPAAPGAENGGM
eukprot:jgi/Tetstr1/427219/TSEL_017407.t1